MGDTASTLGNAMDELMRHQPSLKESATAAIIQLLEELCALGRDPKYVCWKAQAKPEAAPPIEVRNRVFCFIIREQILTFFHTFLTSFSKTSLIYLCFAPQMALLEFYHDSSLFTSP